jgi:S-adenosylmethionine/arginine decarboxylase-like enzyme
MNENISKESGKNDFNPVEKNLDVYFYGTPKDVISDYKLIDEVMSNAINLSRANILEKIVRPIPPGASGIYLLTESEAAFHTTPETIPNFMSFKISTCGNKTHPIIALKYLIEKLNPVAGIVCYYKEGYDISPKKSGFSKTIEALIKKYYEQFNALKYRFNAEEIRQFEYNFEFYDSSRFTQKMASILGLEWPLSEEDKKLGIWLDGKEIACRNGNGNGHANGNGHGNGHSNGHDAK